MLINSDLDKSSKSINYLKNKIEKLFPDDANLFFPDDLNEDPRKLQDKEEVHVVLFGSFCRSLLESSNWKFKNIKFYVLCHSVKEIMVEVFDFDETSVSVIDRSLIEEPAFESKEKHEYSQFVYAGRINENKNIETLVSFVNFLQIKTKRPFGLTLIGTFDEERKLVYGDNKKDEVNFEKKIKNFIEELDWLIKPVFISEKESDQWTIFTPDKSIFVSLSTNLFEDYGVAVSQAKEKGWPLFISDWGGHKEVTGKNILKIPYDYLPQSREFELKGEMIAKYFIENDFNDIVSTNCQFEGPIAISEKEFNKIRDNIFEKYGQSLNLITREHWHDFYQTIDGLKFINSYKQHFIGSYSNNYNCIITNDYYNDPLLISKVLKIKNSNKGLIFIGVHELVTREAMKMVMASDDIYSILDEDMIEQLSTKLNVLLKCIDAKFI